MRSASRWTSFVGSPARGRAVRGLHEEGNPKHRVRVEYNKDVLLVHVSDEDGAGWTTLALDRATREWALAQNERQMSAAVAAYEQLRAKLIIDGGRTRRLKDASRPK